MIFYVNAESFTNKAYHYFITVLFSCTMQGNHLTGKKRNYKTKPRHPGRINFVWTQTSFTDVPNICTWEVTTEPFLWEYGGPGGCV